MQSLLDSIFKPRSNYKLFFFFITVGFLLNIPSIFNGFNFDDFMFVSMLEENIPYNHLTGFWSVDFNDFRSFNTIWWYEKGAEGNFLRPIPTFVFSGLFSIFGRDASYVLHILSALLHGAVGFTVFLMFFRLLKKYAMSLTAGFIYLVCEDHTYTIGWISTNTDIIAVLLMNISFINYISYREKGKALYLLIFIITLTGGLLCKETAVVMPAMILLYEFIFLPGKIIDEKISLRKKLLYFIESAKHWIPAVIILFAYLIIYKTQGFGMNNLFYYDPFGQTGLYLKNLIPGILLMFNGILTPLPFSLAVFIPMLKIPFIVIGAVSAALFIIVLSPYRKESLVQFCFIMLILSLLPQLSADATERQMYYPFVFASFLFSLLIFRLKIIRKNSEPGTDIPEKRLNRISESTTGYYLLLTTVILAFILSIIYPFMYTPSMVAPEKYVKQSLPIIQQNNSERIFYLNTQGIFMTLYATDITRYHLGRYKDLYLLSSFNGKVWVKKNNDSSLSIKTNDKPMKSGAEGWLSNMFAKLVRITPLFEKGRIYEKEYLRAEIIRTTEDKTDVLEVKFVLKYPLTDKNNIFLYYDSESIKQWDFSNNKPDEWYFVGDTSDFMKGMM